MLTSVCKINKAIKEGRRVIAVGTTSARVLESAVTPLSPASKKN
ncbi:S-adenosylmethionine:tRNA ribosyltransferase-isomerase, partial [Patescibacteria group bacterium]|nr:S-adenosylmethionine:tRNA ribosyltransferase-isomerase [Patescibacteria group bacterium]